MAIISILCYYYPLDVTSMFTDDDVEDVSYACAISLQKYGHKSDLNLFPDITYK